MTSPTELLFAVILLFMIQSTTIHSYKHNNIANKDIKLSRHDHTRNMQAFSSINNIISEITLVLPDTDVSSNGLDITITDLICYEANVQDVQVARTPLSDAIDRVSIEAIGLTVRCNFRWNYEWSVLSIFSGSGSGKAVLDQSSGALINLDIADGSPPRDVSVYDCNANVQIGDLILDGDGLGAIASVLNLFKKLLVGVIEEEVNNAVCSEINELGEKDGALMFVIESKEQTVTYETNAVNASSSGVGWLILFIALIIIYSVGCCLLGVCCIGKLRRYNSMKQKSYKSLDDDKVSATERIQDSRTENQSDINSGDPDIECQADINGAVKIDCN